MNDQQESVSVETGEVRQTTFDQGACAILRQAHAMIFARYPEVRSIASTLDYFGALNDAMVMKGVWTSEHGPVDTADGVFGSMFQLLRLLEEQFSRSVELAAQLRDDVQAMGAEMARLTQRNEQLRQEGGEVGDRLPADG